jgi:hypothetical protein
VEIREALEKITDEKHANNVSLASIIREAKVPWHAARSRGEVMFRDPCYSARAVIFKY